MRQVAALAVGIVTLLVSAPWEARAATEFDVCVHDDRTGSELQFSSTTGDYAFCCSQPNGTVSGAGTVTSGGCYTHFLASSDGQTATAEINSCTKRGSASLKSAGPRCSVEDADTTDSTCTCQPLPPTPTPTVTPSTTSTPTPTSTRTPSPYYSGASLNGPPSTFLALLSSLAIAGLLLPTRRRSR